MNIFGNRIIIRAIEKRDSDALLFMMNDIESSRMIGGWSPPLSSMQHERWMEDLPKEKNTLRLAAVTYDDQFIGTFILSKINWKHRTAELHIKILPEFQSQGFGSEIFALVFPFVFEEMNMECLYYFQRADNVKSVRVMLTQNMKREAVFPDRYLRGGRHIDAACGSLLRSEYFAQKLEREDKQ